MTQLKNDRIIRALKQQSVDVTPVWMMRQAGRYLPEYRELRAKAGDFMSLCQNPEWACEVTIQPLRRFPMDAAILFSDILTIPDAMGLGLYFAEGEGPRFKQTVRSDAQISNLPIPAAEDELVYVMNAIRTIQSELSGSVPLLGFSGSPWTLATYMVEGGPSKDFKTLKTMLYQRPEALHALLDKLAVSVTDYLNGQIAAGVNAVQIFDSWGGALSASAYEEFSLSYMRKIISGLSDKSVPVILFTKGGGQWLPKIVDSGCHCAGLDWTTDIGFARQQAAGKISLQGNMDPALLLSNPTAIRDEVGKILASYGHGNGHIFNLGHGITPDVPVENVTAFVDAVHELSAPYHQS